MSVPSPREIVSLWRAKMQSKAEERINIIRSISSKWSGVIVPAIRTGNARTIQILKILLPTMLPTRRSDSPFLAAVMVVTSSGSEVPIAITVSEIMRSDIPNDVAMKVAELTTSWLPPTTPTKPKITNRNDLPSLYFGFSTSFLADLPRRFLRAMEKR